MPEFAEQDEDARLRLLQDRLRAQDWPAVVVAAAEVRLQYWGDATILCHTATAWLAASRPADAATDAERAASLDPANGGAWYLLGLSQDELNDEGAALASLHRACVLEPDNPAFAAMQAFFEARSDSAWRAGFARLIEIHEAHSSNDFVRDLLVRAYLVRAEHDWTVVEASSGGATLVRKAAKVLRLGGGHDEIPPGIYPTTAQHVKTATECLNRAKALGSDDPELRAALAELEADVAATTGRRYNATYGESGLSVVALLGGMVMLAEAPGMGLFGILAGSAMIAGSFEPQYRTNKIALSLMGKTVGDALIGVARGHKYGGLAYLFFLMMFFPAIAGYKLYLNRGEGWLASADLPPLLGSLAQAQPEAELPAAEEPGADRAAAAEVEWDGLPVAEESGADQGASAETEWAEAPPPAPAAAELVAAEAAVEIVAEDDPPSDPPEAEAEAVEAWAATSTEPPAPRPSIADSVRGLAGRARLWPRLPIVAAGAAVAAGVLGLSLWSFTRSPAAAPPAPAAVAAISLPASKPAPRPEAAGPPSVSGSPQVVDTATLKFRGTTVQVSGISGEGGIPARQMDSFIAEQGGQVTCQRLGNGKYRCRTSQGYDLAAAALVNGAARISTAAPDEYREMQSQAQASHKGIWQ